jgi:arsenite methyltransferase
MDDTAELTPDVIYRMVAEVGFRRHFHLGGWEATRQLLELCHLNQHKYVLDVGCASGKTACYVASRYGCKVVGVDILEKMVDRAHERAQDEGVQARVSFQQADAQHLPFEDNLFDVVIGEFITGLVDDKQPAVNGYLRVTKPGGIVALNEATWLKTPVPQDLVEYLANTFGFRGSLLTAEGWKGLLEDAGLRDTVARAYKAEALGSGREGLKDALRVAHKILYMYARNPAFRKYLGGSLSLRKNLLDYFGYGIYVGTK